jgi:mono/diheme cytochrome c family protein
MNRRSLVGLSAAVVVGWGVLAGVRPQAAEAQDAKGVAFFEAKIRPILAQNCVGCHGPDKQKGGLRMDTREHLLAGGKEDEKTIVVIVPGDPAKSKIIEAVEYKNEDLQMPPPKKGKSLKLTEEQITDLKEWVKMNAPYGEKPVMAAKDADK